MAKDTKRAAGLRRVLARPARVKKTWAWIGRVAIAVFLGCGIGTDAAAGEPHRVEVVGIYPIRDAQRGQLNPREEAIQQALWEGVSRVALELIGEEGGEGPAEDPGDAGARLGGASTPDQTPDPTSAPAVPADASSRFRKVLGREILPYTRSFRILEDRGERPVLFADEPGVRSEYLVVVEVLVDVARLKSELARAGLLAPSGTERTGERITIELIGLERHAGLQRVLETLRAELGATRIETLEFSPGRQLLSVVTTTGPDEVAARLGAVEASDLILDPVEIDGVARRLRVLAQWFAPLPSESAGTAERTGVGGPAPLGR